MKPLSLESPFPLRLAAWSKERFPLFRQGLLIVSYYSSNQFLAQALTAPGSAVHYAPHSLAGAVVLLCFFFHLRVFDEHKDYEDDCRHYPERVLSRGWITLRHLKILGAGALILEIGLGAWRGPEALTAILIAMGFSVLMLKEFFAAAWLRRHFVVYAVSHMLIMPLLALMVFSITTQEFPWQAPGWFWLYAWVGFFVTLNWEISRKIRAPGEEREGVDTYSKTFGPFRAAGLVLLVRVIDTGLVAIVGWHLGLPLWFFLALPALFGLCYFGYRSFRNQPSTKTAARLEGVAGLYIVAFDWILAAAIVQQVGLQT